MSDAPQNYEQAIVAPPPPPPMEVVLLYVADAMARISVNAAIQIRNSMNNEARGAYGMRKRESFGVQLGWLKVIDKSLEQVERVQRMLKPADSAPTEEQQRLISDLNKTIAELAVEARAHISALRMPLPAEAVAAVERSTPL